MDWTAQVDAYCERVGFAFWAEPVNALTNALYLLGALWMLWRLRGAGLPLAVLLSVLLGLIAIGSFLFHTLATGWAGLADTAPIALFILVYLFAVNRDFLGLSGWLAGALTLVVLPVMAGAIVVLSRIPFLSISAPYWIVPILLLAYAPFVARHRLATARGMIAGAALLSLSITLRSLDEPLCDLIPIGTHFLWHGLNAILLPFMILLYRNHMLEGRAGGR